MNQPQKRQNGTLDGQIDQALAHLHSAQPPAGLNQRLLQRLGQVAHSEQIARSEQIAHSQQIVISTEGVAAVERPAVASEAYAAPSSASTRLRSALPTQAKFLWPLALSCAIAVVLATLALQPGHPLNPARPNHAQHSEGASTNLPNPAKSELSSATQPLAFPQPSVAPPNPNQAPHSVTMATEHPAPQTPEEAKALDDLHAPSQPAPPLPVTAQEKAILHLLRRDGTVELAQLDPAVQTKLFALQRADLQQFFDPPPPPKLESQGQTK